MRVCDTKYLKLRWCRSHSDIICRVSERPPNLKYSQREAQKQIKRNENFGIQLFDLSVKIHGNRREASVCYTLYVRSCLLSTERNSSDGSPSHQG